MSQTPNMNQKQSLTNKPSRNNNQTYNNTTILTTHYIPPITTHYQATTTPPYQPIHNEPDSEPNLNWKTGTPVHDVVHDVTTPLTT
jgi:hypothetical protein